MTETTITFDRSIGATVLGYPRIGPDRELKRAVEAYWAGRLDSSGLATVAAQLRRDTWSLLAARGLDSVPSNTFSYYDHVLDTAAMLGLLPQRATTLGLDEIDTYFAAAHGTADTAPLELTKWFDTNYHYLVPELDPDSTPSLAGDKPLSEYLESKQLGIETRPVLVGPATFLLLSKPSASAPEGWSPLELLDPVVEVYAELLAALRQNGAAWVQLDEPAYVMDRSPEELAALETVYTRLGALQHRPSLLVTGPYGDLGDALPVLAASPVEAIGLDLVAGSGQVDRLTDIDVSSKTVVAGVVDGRNVWRTDLGAALDAVHRIGHVASAVAVTTSTSLLHVPYTVDVEDDLDPEVRSWLAFAAEKVDELVTLGSALTGGPETIQDRLDENTRVLDARRSSPRLVNAEVQDRTAQLGPDDATREPYEQRSALAAARLGLAPLATTTIGSFPQTPEIRQSRARLRSGDITEDEYRTAMRSAISEVVVRQEEIGLDVIVHGEPERNDMVQYFAEQLDGYAAPKHGWVQSYGSRATRPPILYGDISRPQPMTVEWARYAQSLTDRPVKGMLTGPVTMLAWSFVRDDQPLAATALQVAFAIADETVDLEAAGIGVIQVDEPALRELLPLRTADRSDYLAWAVQAFRVATSAIDATTQIHTHMCYGEFGDIVEAIDAIDADVISIEAARSHMAVVDDLADSGFSRGVGPGVYDIHSPRVPSTDEVVQRIERALQAVPADRLWVNPDCGLKTRRWDEVTPSLTHLVEAARTVRNRTAT